MAYLLRGVRPLVAAPELGLFVVLYLGLSGRGGPIGLTLTALAIGYLRDLLVGAPRGVEALAFALTALVARALHGRVFLDRYTQLAIVCAGFSALDAALVLVVGAGDAPVGTSLRALPTLMASALLFGPIVMRVLRRLDRRLAPESRGLRLESELGGSWR